MPLSTKDIGLLHEIFEIPMTNTVVASPGQGIPLFPALINHETSAKEQLQQGIDLVNESEDLVERVQAILSEYEGFSTDPSNIDSQGYSFRASKSLRSIRKALYPYIGLVLDGGGNSNQLRMG